VAQVRRQRQEQDLARRLVDGLAERRVGDAGNLRRPDRAGQQDYDCRLTQRKRQQQQRDRETQ
jgi:hypothetical protein